VNIYIIEFMVNIISLGEFEVYIIVIKYYK